MESFFSDHFGRTPLQTPFGSQDSSLSCAIDISDTEDEDEPAVIDLNERVRQFIREHGQGDDDIVSDAEELASGDSDDDFREETESASVSEEPTVNQVNKIETDYDDLNKVRDIKKNGCKCTMNCSSKFCETDMINHIQNIREMDKNDKEMYLMGTLLDFDKDKTIKGKKRKRNRRKFMFLGQPVCKNFFIVVYATGSKSLKNIMKHMADNGPVPRAHGNSGKRMPHGLVFEDIKAAVQFIVNYADINGLPQPAAPRGTDNTPPVYLHCSNTKKSVHKEYQDSLPDGARCIKNTTWNKIWRNCVPHLRIASPKDDVCASCEKLRKKIMDARDEEDKLTSTAAMTDHVLAAQNERELYNQCIERAQNGNIDGTNYFHLTFDYCQNVTVPHHGRQMGPVYFTTPRKIQIFGVRIDGIPRQLNFLMDEHETIGRDGTLTNGPNAVISMLDWTLDHYGNDEPSCAFHADNCPGKYNINLLCENKLTIMMLISLRIRAV